MKDNKRWDSVFKVAGFTTIALVAAGITKVFQLEGEIRLIIDSIIRMITAVGGIV